FANKAGHPYIVTQNKYFTNMTPYNEGESYSKRIGSDSIEKSFSYLETTYGKLPFFINSYIRDTDMAEILHHIYSQNIIFEKEETRNKTMDEIRATYAYRLGKLFLKPFYFIRHFFYH
ncbi:MAG: hypothetical protein J6S87_04210, partial [Bacteroidales bacterium]|nr:hypothetical protein [Bacteroidales bacterium]